MQEAFDRLGFSHRPKLSAPLALAKLEGHPPGGSIAHFQGPVPGKGLLLFLKALADCLTNHHQAKGTRNRWERFH